MMRCVWKSVDLKTLFRAESGSHVFFLLKNINIITPTAYLLLYNTPFFHYYFLIFEYKKIERCDFIGTRGTVEQSHFFEFNFRVTFRIS
jgi:hypothetical protein